VLAVTSTTSVDFVSSSILLSIFQPFSVSNSTPASQAWNEKP
jgi:hypothetical protein